MDYSKEVGYGVKGDIAYSVWEHSRSWYGDKKDMVWHTAYIAVPKSHPWYKLDYMDIDASLELTFSDTEMNEVFPNAVSEQTRRIIQLGVWWLGIDFAHHWCHDINNTPLYDMAMVMRDVDTLCAAAHEVAMAHAI